MSIIFSILLKMYIWLGNKLWVLVDQDDDGKISKDELNKAYANVKAGFKIIKKKIKN